MYVCDSIKTFIITRSLVKYIISELFYLLFVVYFWLLWLWVVVMVVHCGQCGHLVTMKLECI